MATHIAYENQKLDEGEISEGELIPIKMDDRKRLVSDIALFLVEWARDNPNYHSLSCNCQTFALNLFQVR